MIICFIIGILSILYGICIMRAASGTMFFLVWFVIGACLLALGVCIRMHMFSTIPKALKVIFLTLITVGAITLFITWGLICSHFHDKGNKNIDYLIVLGAQVKPTGPSVVLQYRLDTAADYLRDNPGTVCIVSGGKSPSEPEYEGDVMARWLIANGIAAERIRIENQSTSTVENIDYSLGLISSEASGQSGISIGIVTNDFHVFRGTMIARKACSKNQAAKSGEAYAGNPPVSRIDGIAAPSKAFYLPNNMLRESMGIVKDFLKGNL